MEEIPVNEKSSIIIQIGEELDDISNFNVEETEFIVPKTDFSNLMGDKIEMGKLFKFPNFNEEMNEVAMKKLTPDMLKDVRKTATFTVPSVRFEGQSHVWELNNMVQRGSDHTRSDLRDGIVFGTKQIIVHVPDRLWKSEIFSTWSGLKAFGWGLLKVPILVLGFPFYFHSETYNNMDEIRRDVLMDLLRFPKNNSYQKILNNSEETETHTHFLKSRDEFLTVDGIKIIIHNLNKIRKELTDTDGDTGKSYELFNNNWNLNRVARREELLSDIMLEEGEGIQLSKEELAQKVRDLEEQMHQEQIYEWIHATLSDETDAKNLCDLMNSIGIVREHIKWHNTQRSKAIDYHVNALKEKHSILSRIPEWLFSKKQKFINYYDKAFPCSPYEILAKLTGGIGGHKGGQESYLFGKNIDISEKVDELSAPIPKKTAENTFTWDFRIWRPSKWIITETERSNGEKRYQCNKYNTFHTESNYVGWRLSNIFIRFGLFMNNGLFGLIGNFFYGPFGLRSWVGLEDFQPDRTVNTKTGELEPCGTKFTPWLGRVRNLWRHISGARQEFEAAPDEGFFGKSFTRPFNLFWNYVCKGTVGTVAAFFGHPILAVLNAILGIGLVVTSPIWSLCGGIIIYLFSILIYDIDRDGRDGGSRYFPLFRYIIWDILLKGLGQVLFTPLVALAHSLCGMGSYIGSLLRFSGRSTWDSLMYYTFIKHKGRVPNRNGFLAKRIRGPGLGMEYYQQIDSDCALLCLQRQFEKMKVETFRNQKMNWINQPLIDLKNYYNQFKDLGLLTDQSGRRIKEFKETQRLLRNKLNETISAHNDSLIIKSENGSPAARLIKEDLDYVLQIAEEMCIQFCKDMPDLTATPEYWANNSVTYQDYKGLAAHYLVNAFSNNILQPLEEVKEDGFIVQINHIDFRTYRKMLWNTESLHDDLDMERVYMHPSTVNNPFMVYPHNSIVVVVTPDNMTGNEKYENFLTIHA
jgi:hypothetical protein